MKNNKYYILLAALLFISTGINAMEESNNDSEDYFSGDEVDCDEYEDDFKCPHEVNTYKPRNNSSYYPLQAKIDQQAAIKQSNDCEKRKWRQVLQCINTKKNIDLARSTPLPLQNHQEQRINDTIENMLRVTQFIQDKVNEQALPKSTDH